MSAEPQPTDADALQGEEAGALEARNAEHQNALIAARINEADAAISRAVRRGAIPTRAFALQARWRALIVHDSSRVEMLDAMPGSSALTLSKQRHTS